MAELAFGLLHFRQFRFPLTRVAPMKYVLGLFICLGVVAVSLEMTAEDPAPQVTSPQLTPLMQMKLEKSKAILEGLTLEDFDKITRNARSLKLLSMESGWNVIQTEEYATQSSDFRRASDMILAAAAEEDINRAALGYVALTVRCVECHSYMRKHIKELEERRPREE